MLPVACGFTHGESRKAPARGAVAASGEGARAGSSSGCRACEKTWSARLPPDVSPMIWRFWEERPLEKRWARAEFAWLSCVGNVSNGAGAGVVC